MAVSVDLLFGPSGPLAAALPGYEPRPEQLSLARAIDGALRGRSYLVAEAGTGTGKTLAYLVPAILSGRKVLISTATKTLQEQVFEKDIPLVRDRMGLSFEAVCLKGRSNYLCLHRWEAFRRRPEFERPEEVQFWPALETWAHQTQTGDRVELPIPEEVSFWGRISMPSESCLGQKCPHFEACFVTRIRRRAAEADLVVVNHHLFFADLALRSGGAGEGVLPSYEAVVFDEAHALEDVATEYFGVDVSIARLDALVQDVQRLLPPGDQRLGAVAALVAQARAHGGTLFDSIAKRLHLPVEGSIRLSRGSLSSWRDEVLALDGNLQAVAALLADTSEPEFAVLERRTRGFGEELRFVAEAESLDHVYWASRKGGGLLLRASPVDVAGELQKRLYPEVDTAIFTSATLKAGKTFEFFAQRMGLAPPGQTPVPSVRYLDVASSFDFSRQAALYVPTHLPDPRETSFSAAVAEELVALCTLTGGRAFALFTSKRNMEAVYAAARGHLPYPSLLQGERPKGVLLEAFRSRPSVLFATYSFWEGVDVAGDALSLVVIDKLPFSSPGDPLVAARVERLKARGEDPFLAYQLPEAAIALRQGFGRLIRTRTDQGLVAILDRRMVMRSYGQTLLASLPPAPVFRDRRQVALWWSSREKVFANGPKT